MYSECTEKFKQRRNVFGFIFSNLLCMGKDCRRPVEGCVSSVGGEGWPSPEVEISKANCLEIYFRRRGHRLIRAGNEIMT